MTIPQTMTALVQQHDGYASERPSSSIEGLDPFVRLERISVPTPKSGQVLIRVRKSAINPSDLAFVQGVYGQPRVKGVPAGFEACGEVVASGGGFYGKYLIGKRVAFFAGISGAWADYAVAEASACIPLRKEIKDNDGASLLVNPFTAWAMHDLVENSGSPAFVMTAGASQLGKLMASLSSDRGSRLISLVRRREQIEPLSALGAHTVIDVSGDDGLKELAACLRKEKPRIFLDALGGGSAASVFLQMGRKSRWVIYGGLEAVPTELPDPGQFIFKDKQIEGFWLTKWLRTASLFKKLKASRGVQDRFASGQWSTDLAAEIPLSKAIEEVAPFLKGANPGKVMLHPE